MGHFHGKMELSTSDTSGFSYAIHQPTPLMRRRRPSLEPLTTNTSGYAYMIVAELADTSGNTYTCLRNSRFAAPLPGTR